MFSCDFCEILRTTPFIENLQGGFLGLKEYDY